MGRDSPTTINASLHRGDLFPGGRESVLPSKDQVKVMGARVTFEIKTPTQPTPPRKNEACGGRKQQAFPVGGARTGF